MPLMQRFSRPAFRLVTAVVLAVIMMLLVGVVFVRSWAASSADATFVTAERRGVAYLQPLSRLVLQLSQAQSAAVRGGTVDAAAIDAAVRDVDAADGEHGAALSTGQRWRDLREGVSRLPGGGSRGAAAYVAYTDATTSALALMRRVGDTSNVVLDPELDSYYLMDTALIRLPDVVVDAGRASDLTVLGNDQLSQTALAVARNRVATSAADIATGLRKSIDATRRSSMVTTLVPPLDRFQAAVDRFVPPVVASQFAAAVRTSELPELTRAVREAAATLSATAWGELDAVLHAREQRIENSRLLTAAAAGLLPVLAVLLVILLVAARRPAPDAETGTGAPSAEQERAATPDLVDARDLLIEELIHVGRAVRPKARGRSNDAE